MSPSNRIIWRNIALVVFFVWLAAGLGDRGEGGLSVLIVFGLVVWFGISASEHIGISASEHSRDLKNRG
jgi:hypothetical protein